MNKYKWFGSTPKRPNDGMTDTTLELIDPRDRRWNDVPSLEEVALARLALRSCAGTEAQPDQPAVLAPYVETGPQTTYL